MASSNRHWPSMFKSKPHPHQWQHDINSPHRSSPFSSGCEERSPEPKPRWNPKPEQIRILEAIFNSGMVNPPREEIRRIRAQLQEYGQVGDANVFYWFQNRKSRSKHKLRLHSKHSLTQSQSQTQSQTQSQQLSSPSSSSSPSPKSTKPRKNKINNNNSNTSSNTNLSLMGMSPSEAAFLFPVSSIGTGGGYEGMSSSSQLGFLTSEMMSNVEEQQKAAAATSGLLLSELMNNTSVSYTSSPHPPHHHHHHLLTKEDEEMRMKMMMLQPQICCYNNILLHPPTTITTSSSSTTTSDSVIVTVPSTSDHLHLQGGVRKRIFINEMEVEITSGPFNVKEAFGEEAVLIDSEGQPLLTDQYGMALNPLQHGASYYLI